MDRQRQKIRDDDVVPLAGTPITPAGIEEERLVRFHAYWLTRAPLRGWPRRADLDPLDIPDLLADLMLVDVCGGRHRYRLVGTHVTDALGMDPTGWFMDELPEDAPFAGLMERIHAAVSEAGRPVYARSRHVTPQGTLRSCGRVLCPLADADGGLAMIATCATVIARAGTPSVVDGGEVVLDAITPIVPEAETEAAPAV